MKRLVYSPSVNAWIKTDTGIFDLSPYITGFSIDRRVNETSKASLEFRNPKVPDERRKSGQRFLFTEHYSNGTMGPMFHPMDPIIITLTRLKGKPIQVFTGYCDTTPYIQLFPGTAELTASCTLKRLQHTYWDPGLPFIRDFMAENGWFITDSGTTLNPRVEEFRKGESELTDSSIGFLLYRVLMEVGNWNKDNIYIQGLPPTIGKTVMKLYEDVEKETIESAKQFHQFMINVLGASAYGAAGGGASDGDESGVNANVDPNDVPPGSGVFEGRVVAQWIIPILKWARENGWTGTLTSGYRTPERNAAVGGSPTSNHLSVDYPGGAIDVGGWGAQAEGQALYDVIKNYPGSPKLVWAGPTIGDWGHFSSNGR